MSAALPDAYRVVHLRGPESVELRSEPLPRRWSIRVGSEPVGRLTGGLLSYNHLDVHTDIGVPLTALVLAWHVLARPWEQAAAPGSLVRR